jgi:hypothetical protein
MLKGLMPFFQYSNTPSLTYSRPESFKKKFGNINNTLFIGHSTN